MTTNAPALKKKILLLRLDKIGDLACSLPADQVLDEAVYDVTWVVQKGLGTVVDLGAKKRKYLELDKNTPRESAHKLRSFLKTLRPDVAISLQGPWWVNYELFRAGVPVRAGVQSQWHSFLFLNHGLRQKRSRAVKHELEYNLDLVYETLGILPTREFHYFEIARPAETGLLNQLGLPAGRYVVVHPGMMGSALNWPQGEYIRLLRRLIGQGKYVAITGTDHDEPYLDQIKKEFSAHPQVVWLQSRLNLPELVQVLASAEFVVAPSTGVAHLTAGTGTPVKGIYSPVQVHHPQRWAPRGPRVEIFMLPDAKAEDII